MPAIPQLTHSLRARLFRDLHPGVFEVFMQRRDIYAKGKSYLAEVEVNEDLYHEWVEEIKKDADISRDKNRELKQNYEDLISLAKTCTRTIVLIDGDGCIFNRDLVERGGEGGRMAASKLDKAVRGQLELGDDELVRVYVFLNRRQLCRTMAFNWPTAGGLCGLDHLFDRFIEGFNGWHPEFNIIDAGVEKQAADLKVESLLKSEGIAPCTKYIVFGGCHDHGYIPTLESLKSRGRVKKRLVLLLSYDETASGPYRTLKLTTLENPGIFLTHRLESPPCAQPSRRRSNVNEAFNARSVRPSRMMVA